LIGDTGLKKLQCLRIKSKHPWQAKALKVNMNKEFGLFLQIRQDKFGSSECIIVTGLPFLETNCINGSETKILFPGIIISDVIMLPQKPPKNLTEAPRGEIIEFI